MERGHRVVAPRAQRWMTVTWLGGSKVRWFGGLEARRKEFAKQIPKSIFPKKKKYRQQEKQTEYEGALAVQVAHLLVEDSDPGDLTYSEAAYAAAMKKAIQVMEGSFVVSSEEEDVKETA